MELSRKLDQERHSNKITAVVQVHASLRNEMLPPGPLHGKAELIYMTNIASSNITDKLTHGDKDEIDELIFLLPHHPETIRFWIDERPVGHPDASKEKIRKGGANDGRHCSVIKVCIEGKPSPADASALKESDIYLPPSHHSSRVWIYLDPKATKQQQKQQAGQKKQLERTTNKPKPAMAPASPTPPPRPKPSHHKPKQPPRHAPAPAPPPQLTVPERTSSKKQPPAKSPLSAHPITADMPPSPTKKPAPPAPKPSTKVPPPHPQPADFKSDIISDISRLMTTPTDPFGRFHSSFPGSGSDDGDDDEEERDAFPVHHHPTLGDSAHFYKAGPRAQSSVFFEGGGGERRIEVEHVERPEGERAFVRVSRRRRLRARLVGVLMLGRGREREGRERR